MKGEGNQEGVEFEMHYLQETILEWVKGGVVIGQ